MKPSILTLRILHGIFTIYFILCLLSMYYAAITKQFTMVTIIAIASLAVEGFMVFVLNKGDCPLIHIQKRIGDPVPFFNLIFPAPFAKKAIPFFSIITLIGLLLLIARFAFG